METQLGFVMVKYVRRIAFVVDHGRIGAGQGGGREDHQFYSQEAGVRGSDERVLPTRSFALKKSPFMRAIVLMLMFLGHAS